MGQGLKGCYCFLQVCCLLLSGHYINDRCRVEHFEINEKNPSCMLFSFIASVCNPSRSRSGHQRRHPRTASGSHVKEDDRSV